MREPPLLPLFAWRPPPKILPFPAAALVAHARRHARAIVGYREAALLKALDRIAGTHETRLLRAGIEEANAASEAQAFRQIVVGELAKLRFTRRDGDAA